jgi:hypothetical protein
MVYVFPVPVAPYANIHTLYPSNSEVINGLTSSKNSF